MPGSINCRTGVGTEAAAGETSGRVRETGPKAKGRRDDFRTFDGLVQPRMELTLRCAPVNSILWILGHVIIYNAQMPAKS